MTAVPSFKSTMPALIRARAAAFGDRRFFVCDAQRLSFADADNRSQELARGLLAIGARKGTRVGLLYPNDVDFVVAYLAVTRIGAVAVPFSTMSTPDELGWQLANSDTEILLGANGYRTKDFEKILTTALKDLDFAKAPPLLSSQAPSLRRIYFTNAPSGAAAWSRDDLLSKGKAVPDAFLAAIEAGVSPADPMMIVYTSGSTSAPKGVMHNQGPTLEDERRLNGVRAFVPDDVLFSNAPFFWIGGLSYCLVGALEAGGCLVCSISQSAAVTLDTIERERPNIVTGFPQSVAHLPKDPSYARRDFSFAVRGNMPAVMAPGVRPADPELRHNKLGSTETNSVYLTHADEGDLPERFRGSFGQPTPGFDVKIVDPDTKQEVPVGTQGEIWVRGPYVMEGYVGKERHEVFTPDGWYRTGDLAHVNEDNYVFFKGRAGDMIKTSGANVSPREVEDVLAAVTGGRAFVLGLQDAEKDQIVAAAVVADNYKGDEATLRAQLKAKISPYKIPKRILFLKEPDVPMMSSGKLDKRKLAEMFRAT
jgi:acyl-CoA synthetase (AMP-forming)/AMP-acid ligase II